MAILKGMLQISIGRNWLSTTANILNANQLFCQALYRHQPSLLLLPHLTREKIKTFRGQKRAVESISDLFSLEEAERAALLKDFDSKQIADINEVASKYQQAFFINAEYVVEGEPAIIPSSIVTLNVKVGSWSLKPRVDYDKAFGEPDKKQWWEDSKGANAYTPGLAHKRNPSWYVSLTNHQIDRVICAGKITGLDKDKTVKLQFQAPPQAGSWTFTIYCMSDSYPETTIRRELELVVEDHSAAPLIEEEDDISDPEDYIVKAPEKPVERRVKTEYDDSSDSDNEAMYIRDEHDGHDHGPSEDFVE